jgi:hypothetical protein
MKRDRLLIVIYDGVENSVFESLVLRPAIKYLTENLYSRVDIVSFEVNYSSALEKINSLSLPHGLSIFLHRRLPVVSKISLFIHAPVLARILWSNWYDNIIVRGPIAAYLLNIAIYWFIRTLSKSWSVPVIIQARGLAAEEARFTFHEKHSNTWFLKQIFEFRVNILKAIEQVVYQQKSWDVPMKIVAVSEALKDYLVQAFAAEENNIDIEFFDIVPSLEKSLVFEWREELRDFLKIPSAAVVYGYSGSCKQWQCSNETVDFLLQKITEDKNNYGLILSTDALAFQRLVEKSDLDTSRLLIRFVEASDLIKWLSVFDFGLLLRYQDVVNWVSRPTKALEYIAVGIPIIHNKTVKWLIDYDQKLGGIESDITPQPRQISLS